MNLPATYEKLMYSEYRPDLVDMLNYTRSIYDRARNFQKNKYELITFFRIDCRIPESEVEVFHRGSYIANCFAYLKSRKSWLSAKISLIDKKQNIVTNYEYFLNKRDNVVRDDSRTIENKKVVINKINETLDSMEIKIAKQAF